MLNKDVIESVVSFLTYNKKYHKNSVLDIYNAWQSSSGLIITQPNEATFILNLIRDYLKIAKISAYHETYL